MSGFVAACLGHFASDYLLQNKKMALAKSTSGTEGWLWCTLHCIIYTLTVALFVGDYHLWFVVLVFASHFAIDQWSLADKYLGLIGGRTFKAAYESTDRCREFDIAFTAIVYTVADNTMHLILIWFIMKLFGY